MFNTVKSFWLEWKNTAVGKSVEDFYWNVLYTSVLAGLTAALPLLAGGETNYQAVWGVFTTGVSIAFFKSVSLFVDKYKNPRIPNTPTD